MAEKTVTAELIRNAGDETAAKNDWWILSLTWLI